MTDVKTGLSEAEVQERIAAGQVNGKQDLQTRSILSIVRSNVCTLFNAVNVCLAVLILVMSKGAKWNDTLFMGIVFFNLFVGIFQEIRAKKTIEKLSIISAPKASVVRGGKDYDIEVDKLVLGDLTVLAAGKQICADCVVTEGSVEVDESLITGESDPIVKRVGDNLLSGSFVVSGKCYAEVVHVGADNYAAKIANGARRIKKQNSEILRSLRAIIKLMSIIVVPLGVALLLKQKLIAGDNTEEAVLKMAGSVVSMIPQGLIALSTTVFAVGVIRLSKHNTLSQDLYSIETLARVDVLCLDKTGTITQGTMSVTDVVKIEEGDETERAVKVLTAVLQDNNPTFNAMKNYAGDNACDLANAKPFAFSSERKWSGVTFEGGGYVMGAMEFIAPDLAKDYAEQTEEYARQGKRVITLAAVQSISDDYKLSGVKVLGFVLIEDNIREAAPDTIRYFKEQGVDVRIISGDNPVTVSAIAKKVGFEGADKYVDASTFDENTDLHKMLAQYKIFGRVTPQQKLDIIKAFKEEGHTVAMTGDGVNDVLALKEANCSVAMAAGSDVARSVSSLVLLDNDFASMPKVVAEGRRSINNLQRSSSLYLVKTMYAVMLAIIFLFIGSYPFEPSHLTLVGVTTIGLPSFFLALEPNREKVSGSFIYNSLRKALPGSLTIVLGIVAIQVVGNFVSLSAEEADMLSLLMVASASFMVLFRVCLPLDVKHLSIFCGMLLMYLLGWFVLPEVFNMMPITDITITMLWILLPLIALGAPILALFIFLEKCIAARGKPKILSKLNIE